MAISVLEGRKARTRSACRVGATTIGRAPDPLQANRSGRRSGSGELAGRGCTIATRGRRGVDGGAKHAGPGSRRLPGPAFLTDGAVYLPPFGVWITMLP